jgi:hypothetical protein
MTCVAMVGVAAAGRQPDLPIVPAAGDTATVKG